MLGRDVVETNARANRGRERDVAGARGFGRSGERAGTISHRTATELPPKSTSEDLVTGEAAGERDLQHGVIRSDELAGRSFQPEALDELPRGLSQQTAQGAVQMETRSTGPGSHYGERHRAVQVGA